MVDLKGLLSNPMAAYQSARQPGGLLAPVTSMNEFLGDPRVNIGLAIASGQPIGKAIMGGALQAQTLQETFAKQNLKKKIADGTATKQDYISLYPELAAKSLFADPEETFTLLTDLEKQESGLPIERTYQKSDISGAIKQVGSSPTVVVEGDSAGETEEQKVIGKTFGEKFTNIVTSGDKASTKLNDIDTMETLLNNSDLQTGFAGELRTSVQKIGEEFGVDLDVQNTPAAEVYRALSGKVLLNNLEFTKGAISDREMTFFTKISPGLTMSEEGNRLFLDIAKRKNKIEVAYKNAAENWALTNGGLSKPDKNTGMTWNQFTNEFNKENPIFNPDEKEQLENISMNYDPQFAGNAVHEVNGKIYYQIGDDFYER